MNSTINRSALLRRSLFPAAGILLAASVATLFFKERSAEREQIEANWVYVEPQVLESQIGLVGTIESAKSAIVAAPFEGYIKDLSFAPGQFVDDGERLLTFDTALLDAQIRDAQMALLKAQLNVKILEDWSRSEEVTRARRAVSNAQTRLDDTEGKLQDTLHLFERGIVARMEVDSLEQQASTQRTDLSAAQAELRTALDKGQGEYRMIADLELANAQAVFDDLQALHTQHQVYAPFPGVILPIESAQGSKLPPPVQIGMKITQGAPLVEVASLEHVEIVTLVDESDLVRLIEGMPVKITGNGFTNEPLQGCIESIGVRSISSETRRGSARYEVIIALAPLNQDQRRRIRLGMSARLAIITHRSSNGLALPPEALHQNDEGLSFVIYRKNMHDTPQEIIVQTGAAVPQGVEVLGMKPGYVKTTP